MMHSSILDKQRVKDGKERLRQYFDGLGQEQLLALLSEQPTTVGSSGGQTQAAPGLTDDEVLLMVDDVERFQNSYPGGLAQYLSNAKRLLADAAEGRSYLSDLLRLEMPTQEQVAYVPPHADDAASPQEIWESEEVKEWFGTYERKGLRLVTETAFVLVAGGLGERLGYGGIKLELPVETATGTTYLEHYMRWISRQYEVHSMNSSSSFENRSPQLAIMTSDDTHEKTIKLLESIQYAGWDPKNVALVKQESVFALADAKGSLVLQPSTAARSPYSPFSPQWSPSTPDRVEARGVVAAGGTQSTLLPSPTARSCCRRLLRKPHGHGDVHALLWKSGLVEKWQNVDGIRYVVFMQDTHAAATLTVPVSLALMESRECPMQFTCIPRKSGEAVGTLCQVTLPSDSKALTAGTPSTGREGGRKKSPAKRKKSPSPATTPRSRAASSTRTLVMNVEYNLFDPLYVAQHGTTETPRPSGYSYFPGSINTLLLSIEPYAKAMKRSGGAVPEFVNPKYQPDGVSFKSPARLECMMQDVVLLLEDCLPANGVVFPRNFYAPVKNSMAEAVKKVQLGLDAHSAGPGEAAFYSLHRLFFKAAGARLDDQYLRRLKGRTPGEPGGEGHPPCTFGGLFCPLFPIISADAAFGAHLSTVRDRLPTPKQVHISERSALILKGDVTILKLELDGALMVEAAEGCSIVLEDVVVKNQGWQALSTEELSTSLEQAVAAELTEIDSVRGFTLAKTETTSIQRSDPGTHRVTYRSEGAESSSGTGSGNSRL